MDIDENLRNKSKADFEHQRYSNFQNLDTMKKGD